MTETDNAITATVTELLNMAVIEARDIASFVRAVLEVIDVVLTRYPSFELGRLFFAIGRAYERMEARRRARKVSDA